MKIFGELKGTGDHRSTVKSPVISITDKLVVDLVYNDVPVTLFYRHGNYPWQSLLINNVFNPEAIPKYSDIYLLGSLSKNERIVYDITY